MSRSPRSCQKPSLAVLWVTAGFAVTLWCAGCGSGASEPAENAKSSVASKSPSKKSSDGAGKKQGVPGPPPNSADAAVKAVLQGIRNNQPEAVWEFLPGSYQKDINGLFHLFAEKMDPELWSRTTSLGKRLVKLCRTRKAEILSSPVFARQATVDPQALSSDWDATVTMAETLLDSSLSDLKQMKSFDGGKFLASTGGKLMNELARFSQLLPGNPSSVELGELAKLEVKVMSTEGKTANVELSLEGEDKGKLVEFVQIEGKWFPKNLSTNMPDYVKSMRNKIQTELAADVLEKKKKAAFQQFDLIEKELEKLEAARSFDEFQKEFVQSRVAGIVVAVFRGANTDGNPPPSVIPKGKQQPSTGKAQRITVIVQRTLDRTIADQVADKLFDLAKDADIGDFIVSGTTTQFPVTTKLSFAAFRKAIKFAEVVSSDEKKREIVIRLK